MWEMWDVGSPKRHNEFKFNLALPEGRYQKGVTPTLKLYLVVLPPL